MAVLHRGAFRADAVTQLRIDETSESLLRAHTEELELTLRERVGNEVEAEKLFEAARFLALSPYQPSQAPYAGPVSNERHCPEEWKPQDLEGPSKRGFLASANSRKALSDCADKDRAYLMLRLVLHCAPDKIYDLQAYAAPSEDARLRALFESAKCDAP